MTEAGMSQLVAPALVSDAAGQASTTGAMHNARRLGGATAFDTLASRTAASLGETAAARGMAEDIRMVPRESGIPETADAVLSTLASATPGDYSFEATDARGRSYPVVRRTIRVEACPPSLRAQASDRRQVVAPTCRIALSASRVRDGYQITVDATRSTSGSAPAVQQPEVPGVSGR